ncbi:MAG: MBL fold metallo-hydrolase [Candidatus Pacearchaeota archaeon]|jgi:phosphoribosyl 1,2-cyclic phosphodiesterase
MELCALASGSSGNCFYVSNGNSGILIDAGISTKQIIERMSLINKGPETIKAIFITHEHSDHIRGADVFARKFNVPIFATKKTIQASCLCSNENLINSIKNDETINLNGVEVEAFSKFHKAADPVSYNISNGKKISIITDVGCVCNNVIKHVSDSDFLCIESNYDEEMLESGPYPYFLKKWIKSDIGHLSNAQSASCILENAKPSLKHVMLSHLSKNNNSPELALNSFNILKQRKDFSLKISVSQRESPTALFKI